MGMNEKNIWILIRHFDRQEPDDDNFVSSLRQVTLPSVLTFAELKSAVYSWADVAEDDSKVVKLRQYNNNLIPLSMLLQGSSKEKPFILEVVGVHQFCPVKKKTTPSDHISALRSKITDLEKRVASVENSIADIGSIHIKAVEEAVSQLSNCVGFLDRRLDELAPPDWKAQIGTTI